MLLPRFTLRTILAIVTGCAVLFVVLGMAARGQDWAWGVVIGVVSLGVALLVHAALFGLVLLFARLTMAEPEWGDASVGDLPSSAQLSSQSLGRPASADAADQA